MFKFRNGAPPDERLLHYRHVNPETGCWEWTGALNNRGYGVMTLGGVVLLAHRVAAHLWLGFDQDSPLFICHHCDNRKCIKPEHLFPGTHSENILDAVRKGRVKSPALRGEAHPGAKLTAELVGRIRQEYAAGRATYCEIAERYGVSRYTIGEIVRREQWRSVA